MSEPDASPGRPDASPGRPDAAPGREQDGAGASGAQQGEVRRLPVVAETRSVDARREVPLPTAVAAGTGGFLLGMASFVLVRIMRRPQPARLRVGSGRRRGKRVEVAGSRSFLVDIHMLKDR